MTTNVTPKERISWFLAGKPVDRTPCVPLILNHAARVTSVSIRDFATDGDVMGAANVGAYRRYGQDLITIFTDTSIIAEAMGSVLYFPEDDVSRLKQPAVEDPEDINGLGPVNTREAGRLPVYLDAIRHCVEEVGDEVYVSCCIPAPFTTAAGLRSTASLARDLYKRPDLARALISKSAEVVADFSEAVAEAGGIPVIVDPVASGSVISAKAFEEFVLPSLKPLMDKIASMGFPPILHICGRAMPIVELMAESGATVLSIDQTDLAEAREKVGSRVCLMGNVRPTETLLGGTPDDVRREAEACLAACKDNPGGFILATGCEVPVETPGENIDALMTVARQSAA